MATTTPAPMPPPNYYDCSIVHKLPLHGEEILGVAAVAVLIIVTFSVTFLDVAIKQWSPTFLDPIVAARVALLQKLLPNLGLSEEEKKCLYENKNDDEGIENGDDEGKKNVLPVVKSHYVYAEDGTPIEYDSVVSQAPYVASKSVDDDLLIKLANNQLFETVSDYCSCTVRGYAMLSMFLPTMVFFLALSWMNNAVTDPKSADFYGVLALIGYFFGVCTGIVMDHPPQPPVHRNANIMLFMNYPLKGPGSDIGKLHTFGVITFALVPTICHLIQTLTWGEQNMPNYKSQLTIIIISLSCAAVFGLAGKLPSLFPGKLTKNQANEISIVFEILTLLIAMIGFAYWELESAMICAGHTDTLRGLMMIAFFAPFALISRHYCWAPTEFGGLPPSVALVRNGEIVGLFGPCPAEQYYKSTFAQQAPPRVKLTKE